MKLIRELTPVEKKFIKKYREQLEYHEGRVKYIRELLGDAAIAFSGREGHIVFSSEALFEQTKEPSE